MDLTDSHKPTPSHDRRGGPPLRHRRSAIARRGLRQQLRQRSPRNGLSVIDTTTNTATGTVTVGSTPDAVAVTPDQTTALVTNEGDNTLTVLHVNQAP